MVKLCDYHVFEVLLIIAHGLWSRLRIVLIAACSQVPLPTELVAVTGMCVPKPSICPSGSVQFTVGGLQSTKDRQGRTLMKASQSG